MSFLCKDSILLVDSCSCLLRSCCPGLFHFLSLYTLMFLTMELRFEALSHGPSKPPLLRFRCMSDLYPVDALLRFYDLDGCCIHSMSGGRCFLYQGLLLRLLIFDSHCQVLYAMGSRRLLLLNCLFHCLRCLSYKRPRSGYHPLSKL